MGTSTVMPCHQFGDQILAEVVIIDFKKTPAPQPLRLWCGRSTSNEWKYQHRSTLKKLKRKSIRKKRRLASGQTQTLLQDPAIKDKLVGPVFSLELVFARLQSPEDDSLIAFRADADRSE